MSFWKNLFGKKESIVELPKNPAGNMDLAKFEEILAYYTKFRPEPQYDTWTGPQFREWLLKVNAICLRERGVNIFELDDYMWRSVWEDELTPEKGYKEFDHWLKTGYSKRE